MRQRSISFATLALAAFALTVATFGAMGAQWRELSPSWTGRVSGIVALDAATLLMATPGGGVWRSTDSGATFSWAGNYGLGDFTAVDLAVDRNDPNRLFLRTWNGVLVSTDRAASWTRTLYSQRNGGDTSNFLPPLTCGLSSQCDHGPPGYEPKPFTQMVFSSVQSTVLTSLPCGGLQYSTDHGASFQQHWPFAPESTQGRSGGNCIMSIAADEISGHVYIANLMASEPGVWRSARPWTPTGPPSPIAGEAEWVRADAGLPPSLRVDAIAWGGQRDRLMLVITDTSAPSGIRPFLYDGATWTERPVASCANAPLSNVRPLVWGGGDDYFLGGIVFAYTVSAGNDWICPPLVTQFIDIRAIHANRALGRVWIGGDANWGSNDLISSFPWTMGSGLGSPTRIKGTGITALQAYSVALIPRPGAPARISVGAHDTNSACSSDGGNTWSLERNGVIGVIGETQSIIWRRHGAGDVLYGRNTTGPIVRATNASSAAACGDISYSEITYPDSFVGASAMLGPHTMAVQPNDPDRVFAIPGGGPDSLYDARHPPCRPDRAGWMARHRIPDSTGRWVAASPNQPVR
ncbi:MAG: hypothetical protein EXQ95_08040 [Alphaproteobacteria bacterium]|nr:hypothetical protein [Alphaproteobacteria bacterium]